MRILTIKIYISFGGHQTQTLGVQSFTRYAVVSPEHAIWHSIICSKSGKLLQRARKM